MAADGFHLRGLTCQNGVTQNGPGIAELDAPAGAYPRRTGGPTMLTHPHPPRIDGAAL